jgi:hypothetical protein
MLEHQEGRKLYRVFPIGLDAGRTSPESKTRPTRYTPFFAAQAVMLVLMLTTA